MYSCRQHKTELRDLLATVGALFFFFFFQVVDLPLLRFPLKRHERSRPTVTILRV